MIFIKPKIHDSNTLEFKVGFVPQDGVTYNDFSMNTWIFIPEVLDVNKHTYTKDTFYCDILSHLRLITPSYRLMELADAHSLPCSRLADACRRMAEHADDPSLDALQSEIKMFASIVKSSIRDAFHALERAAASQRTAMTRDFLEQCQGVLAHYRSLRQVLAENEQATTYYNYGDEFISNILEQHCGRIIKLLARRQRRDIDPALLTQLQQVLGQEHAYRRQMSYICVEQNSPDGNGQFVYHAGQLKKYIESNLYLPTHKRRSNVFLEQVAFSLAAGIAMVFATVVSFAFQQTYGNFTMEFFIALVISYMFKDRIKDLIHNYFANSMGSRLYDYITTIRIGANRIGHVKEGFDFVSPADVSKQVNKKRARRSPLVINRGVDEQVIQYRKHVHIRRKAVQQLSDYPLTGVNNIVRYNLAGFMRKMDNPQVSLFVNDGSAAATTTHGNKLYYLNFVIHCKYAAQSEYKRYRVCLCRDGIKGINEIK